MREQGTTATQAVSKSVLAVLLKQKLPMQARTLSHFSREGGCGKVQCQLDLVASLESKMARRKTSQANCESNREEQLTSYLETTR